MAPCHSVLRTDAVALITGGASGIGLAIASRCLSHCMKVAIVDREPNSPHSALATLQSQLQHNRTPDDIKTYATATYATDVGDEAAWHTTKLAIFESWGGVDFLVLSRHAHQRRMGRLMLFLQTNIFGVTNGISIFLSHLQTRPAPSSIVITGSKQGITNPPGNAAYNASKAALRFFAESLSLTLPLAPATEHGVISVHILVPGWTYTRMTAGGSDPKKNPEGAWWPEQVAEYLEEKMGKGEFYIICPDNDTTEAIDRGRTRWGNEDMVERRPPLMRWRGTEWKRKADEWMGAEEAVGR